MDPDVRIEPIEDQSSADAVRAELERRIVAFNEEATGFHDGRTLTFVVRNDDGLIAGIDGFTWGGYAEIEYLFVDERHRSNGLGRALMQRAEEEARRRGCAVMTLDTHEFQAPAFYERLGFTRSGSSPGAPRGSAHHHYRKRLDD